MDKSIKINITEKEKEIIKSCLKNISQGNSQRLYAILLEIHKEKRFTFE